MTIKLGIDPGFTGALCAEINGEYVFHDMPLCSTKTGKNVTNVTELARLIREIGPDVVGIEQVGAMPGQGVSSMFRFGECFGAIQGVCAALGLSVRLIPPASWKKRFGMVGADKDYARTLAIQQFPEAAAYLARKKDIGRADALWLLKYLE